MPSAYARGTGNQILTMTDECMAAPAVAAPDNSKIPLRVALAQITCSWGDAASNLRKIEEYAVQAAETGASWVLFPELTIPGIFKSPEVFGLSEPVDGPSMRRACRLARRLSLAIGVASASAPPGSR